MQIRKNLKIGAVEMVLLHLLQERSMYGYELLQKMEQRSDEKFILNNSTIYLALHRMINKGLVTDQQILVGRRTRTNYHITEKGESYLEQIKAEYFYITKGISRILNHQESPSVTPNANRKKI